MNKVYKVEDDWLIFNDIFNEEIDNYNDIIKKHTKIDFGYRFDKNLDLSNNKRLTHLKLSSYFNQELNLENNINLTHLELGRFTTKIIYVPDSLIYLSINHIYNKYINISKIKHLKLNVNNSYLMNDLTNSLEILELDEKFVLELINLPNSIKKVIFSENSVYDKSLDNLPNSVEYLKLPQEYILKIKKFPKNLKKIVCVENYPYIDDFKNYEVETYEYIEFYENDYYDRMFPDDGITIYS